MKPVTNQIPYTPNRSALLYPGGRWLDICRRDSPTAYDSVYSALARLSSEAMHMAGMISKTTGQFPTGSRPAWVARGRWASFKTAYFPILVGLAFSGQATIVSPVEILNYTAPCDVSGLTSLANRLGFISEYDWFALWVGRRALIVSIVFCVSARVAIIDVPAPLVNTNAIRYTRNPFSGVDRSPGKTSGAETSPPLSHRALLPYGRRGPGAISRQCAL